MTFGRVFCHQSSSITLVHSVRRSGRGSYDVDTLPKCVLLQERYTTCRVRNEGRRICCSIHLLPVHGPRPPDPPERRGRMLNGRHLPIWIWYSLVHIWIWYILVHIWIWYLYVCCFIYCPLYEGLGFSIPSTLLS